MKYQIIFIALLLLTSFSCRTIKERDFTVQKNTSLSNFPPLVATANIDNLKEEISHGKLRLSGYYNGVIKVSENFDSYEVIIYDEDFSKIDYLMNPEFFETKAQIVPELRVYDILKLLSNEVYAGHSKADMDYAGRLQLELSSFNEKKDIALTLLSLSTLCIPALIGVPINNIKSTIEIKVSVFNRQNELVKSYVAHGRGNAFIAMYWGYGKDAWRKSALLAFSNAMSSIKRQMEEERTLINSNLKD